jgi:hypothetical protein
MRGAKAEAFVILSLRLLAVSFAVVGILFIAVPSGVLDTISDLGDSLGGFSRAPHTQEDLWLALAFAYMVVITGICVVAQADVVRYRPLILVLARLARLLPLRRARLHLPAQLPRRRLPRPAGALALLACRPDRTPDRPRLTAPAGALGRRAAHPERDLRGDGPRARRPARR